MSPILKGFWKIRPPSGALLADILADIQFWPLHIKISSFSHSFLQLTLGVVTFAIFHFPYAVWNMGMMITDGCFFLRHYNSMQILLGLIRLFVLIRIILDGILVCACPHCRIIRHFAHKSRVIPCCSFFPSFPFRDLSWTARCCLHEISIHGIHSLFCLPMPPANFPSPFCRFGVNCSGWCRYGKKFSLWTSLDRQWK